MDTMQLTFDVPPKIRDGLALGEYYRTGGVIRDAAEHTGGQIVMHLREISATPLSNSQFPNFLGMAGNVCSVLNLGATVAFGVAILHKLGKMDKKLNLILDNIDKLQWTVDMGFYHCCPK